jgi:ribosomal protein S18 acetylase RimI-like enzyme
MQVKIETYKPAFGAALEALQRRYIAAALKGTKFVPKELYQHHPALEEGKNVFCAFGADGALLGYGALIPTPADPASSLEVPNTIWVDPELSNFGEVQEAVYQRILDKSLAYGEQWQGRRTRVAISYPDGAQEEIAFFAAQGLERFDALLQMARDLGMPAPGLALPDGISVKRWGMETREEKEKYLAAEAAVFPGSPRTLEELEFYVRSWQGGTAVTAFDAGGDIVGSVMAYWYGEWNGVTEDIFVVPQWRRCGIARGLIAEGIDYLVENGIRMARLEVKESNAPAVSLYRSLGYEVASREEQLGMYVNKVRRT